MTRYEYLAKQEKAVFELLKSKGIYGDVYTHNMVPVVSVEISWGDWKHDHLWCDDVMAEAGFKKIGTQVTEEDGGDAYSATHNYLMTDEMMAGFKSIDE